MSLPDFPEFVKVDISVKAEISEFFRKYPLEASEYTFTNIFAFQKAYDFQLSVLNDNLIIKSNREALSFFCPVGETHISETMQELFGYMKKRTANPLIERVPESFVDKYINGNGSMYAEEDRDNFDYLYDIRELIDLKGRKFHDKKNRVNKFRSAFSYEYVSLIPEYVDECLAFEDYWCEIKECGKYPGLEKERCAILEILNNLGSLNVQGGMIKINDKIAAMTVGEQFLHDTIVIHAEKAHPHVAGLYQVINQEFLIHNAHGFSYVNREQDLGFRGLRRAKISYNPIRFVKKYKVSQITG